MAVVLPLEPAGEAEACLKALKSLPLAERRLISELWLARGLSPSAQRNAALRAARCPWVLFLDSDSRLQPGSLPRLLEAAQGPGLAGAGGPNLAPPGEGRLARAADRVLGSWAGSWRSRARYRSVGQRRPAGEKELILCNLLLRRDALLGAGGFDEALYPNEENALINRLQDQGWGLAYEPQAVVLRPRRATLSAFMAQSFRYGRGRACQARRAPHASDAVNFLPLALLVAWPLAWAHGWAWGLALGLGALGLASQRLDPLAALLLLLRHHAYALGLLSGLWPQQRPAPGPVTLEQLPWRP